MKQDHSPVAVPREIAEFADHFAAIRQELERVFVGHAELVTDLLAAVSAGGHVLLEGVPGLGKTLLARSLAAALELTFSRIQFTPDLLPADITGSLQLLESPDGTHRLEFRPGPLVAHFILADEINRATPKTQSALLEAMQERQITAGDRTLRLPDPFIVVATENPIEQEGTYALPEAELDRFLVKLELGYPAPEEYLRIIDRTTGVESQEAFPVANAEILLAMRRTVRAVLVAESVKQEAVRLVMATQPGSVAAPAATTELLLRGAGPRAAQGLILMAKVYALLDGRSAAGVEDVRRAALPVLRHRIAPNFEARMRKLSADAILERILRGAKG